MPKMNPLDVAKTLEDRRAMSAKLAALKKTGISRREFAALPPDLQLGIMDAGIRLFDPTPEQLTTEWAAQGKRGWSEWEIAALAPGKNGTAGVLAGQLWGRGVAEALAAEFKAARAEGRILEGYDGRYSPLSSADAAKKPPPELLAALAGKVALALLDAGNLHCARLDRLARGENVPAPADLLMLAGSASAEERRNFVVEIQKLGKVAAESPELLLRLRNMATGGDGDPVCHSRAYQAYGALAGIAPDAPAAPATGGI